MPRACLFLTNKECNKGASSNWALQEMRGKEIWRNQCKEDFPLCPPLVFGSSPVPVSLLPLGIVNDIFCHWHFMPTYYPTWALFSSLAGVLLPGTAAGLPNPTTLCSWSSRCSGAGWKCSCEESHSLKCAGYAKPLSGHMLCFCSPAEMRTSHWSKTISLPADWVCSGTTKILPRCGCVSVVACILLWGMSFRPQWKQRGWNYSVSQSSSAK